MILNPTPTKQNRKLLKKLYQTAFPRSEKKPYLLIERKCREGSMERMAIEEDGQFLGLAITILHKDIVLLDYFAVSPESRGKGIGSAILKELTVRYPGKRILLEIEDPEEPCKNREDRLRRKAFYLRNGLTVQNYKVWLFGVKMLILTLGGSVTFEEYHETYAEVFTSAIRKRIKKA